MKNSKETVSPACYSFCLSNMMWKYVLSCALISLSFISFLAIRSASKIRLYLITLHINNTVYYPMYPLAYICCLLCFPCILDSREIDIYSFAISSGSTASRSANSTCTSDSPTSSGSGNVSNSITTTSTSASAFASAKPTSLRASPVTQSVSSSQFHAKHVLNGSNITGSLWLPPISPALSNHPNCYKKGKLGNPH
jgi:hypothetical protein